MNDVAKAPPKVRAADRRSRHAHGTDQPGALPGRRSSPARWPQILDRGRSEIERSVTNVRDATDWGNKLVQKIYANPFVLSPFYKPINEDLRVQTVYDTAQVFTKGAQELHDAAKTLDAMQRATSLARATAGGRPAPATGAWAHREPRQDVAVLGRGIEAAGGDGSNPALMRRMVEGGFFPVLTQLGATPVRY